MPLSVIFLIRSFSSLALFILSNCFYMVLCWRSEAAFAAYVFFELAGLCEMFGANVHSWACFSYSYCSFVFSVLSLWFLRILYSLSFTGADYESFCEVRLVAFLAVIWGANVHSLSSRSSCARLASSFHDDVVLVYCFESH